MKITKLTLENFRLFEKLELPFPNSNFIVFIGENGSGKSAILDAIAIGLSNIYNDEFMAMSEFLSPIPISVEDIRNRATDASIDLSFNGFGKSLKILTSTTRRYSWPILSREPIPAFPILTYYRVNRTQDNTIKKLYDSQQKKSSKNQKKFNSYRFAFDKNISAFSDFEKWFIVEENIENEQKLDKKDFNFELDSLIVIRKAIVKFLTAIHSETFSNLRVRRTRDTNLEFSEPSGLGELIINKGEEEVKLSQLSSGEKMILFLVTDIARRLLLLNDESIDALEKTGIVLIDEIEMHLHPKWQREIVPALKSVFPNIQFIATTHSPQVLSNLSMEDVIVLDEKTYHAPNSNPKGRDSNGILEEVLGSTTRPMEIDSLISEIFVLLSNQKNELPLAEIKLKELRKKLSKDDPILIRIENIISRKKITSS